MIIGLKKRILKAGYSAGKRGLVSHIPSAFSILDILWTLYAEHINLDLVNNEKDRFLLSKGHGCLALYVVLDQLNICQPFKEEDFLMFGKEFGGIPHPNKIKGIEFSGGSLGHGLPVSVGMALGYKVKNNPYKVYVLVGDGEIHEGTNWESFMLASNYNLNNLCCIIENNNSNENSVSTEHLFHKVESFGLKTFVIDGHNKNEIKDSLNYESPDKPVCIIANTVKGNGCKDFEVNANYWHTQVLEEEAYQKYLAEIDNV